MTNVTTSDLYRVISGDPIEIEFPYPLDDPPGAQWRMAQPTDWLYDMALAVSEAAEAEIMQQPEVQNAKTLPPSKPWVERQERSIALAEEAIAALEAKGDARLPEEDISLHVQRDYLSRLIRPDKYTRAQEIAADVSNAARNNYLLQRLVIDQNGKPLFDPADKAGAERWSRLGRNNKKKLLPALTQALVLVQIAKNYSGDLNSQ